MERAMRELVDICEDFAGGVMCYLEPGSYDNMSVNVGMSGPIPAAQRKADIDRFISFYESRGVEPRAELCFHADKDLMLELGARGLTVRELNNILARPIDRSVGSIELPHGWPTDDDGRPLRIERVDPSDDDAIRTAAEIANLMFHEHPEPITPTQHEMHRRIAAHPRSEVLLAFFGDTPVATAGAEHPATESDPPVSALFAAATLNEYRGRGVQQALILHRLRTSLAGGAAVATIHAQPGIPTERNCARLGFHLSYAKIVLAKSGPGLVPSV